MTLCIIRDFIACFCWVLRLVQLNFDVSFIYVLQYSCCQKVQIKAERGEIIPLSYLIVDNVRWWLYILCVVMKLYVCVCVCGPCSCTTLNYWNHHDPRRRLMSRKSDTNKRRISPVKAKSYFVGHVSAIWGTASWFERGECGKLPFFTYNVPNFEY